jgi:Aminoglycoside-2''-adenylyltransferase
MDTMGNTDFAAVSAVCSLLSGLTVPYWIAGGWAIDLAVGRVTRDHADVDVMLLERDKRALWDELAEDKVQITGRDKEPRRFTLHSQRLLLPTEVFLAEAVGTFWVHRRGAFRVKRPLADITRD